jgi:hypothetical protein
MPKLDTEKRFFVVTGSSSGIGAALRKRFLEFPSDFGGDLLFVSHDWRLGNELDPKYSNYNLIHLAHSRSLTLEQNIFAINKLANVIGPGSIFLSTVSAHSQSQSKYGKSKFYIENFFLDRGATVVKSGLICSENPTAMLRLLHRIVVGSPFIPLPFNGRNSFFLTSEQSLVSLIAELTHNPRNLSIRAFSNESISFEELLKDLATFQGVRRLFIPIPRKISLLLIKILRRFFGHLSVVDSLISLLNSPNQNEMLRLSDSGIDFPANPHLIKYN